MPAFSNIDSPSVFWIAALISAFVIGFSKSGISGAGILAIPLMAFIFPPRESTGILLPMLVMGDLIGVYFYRQHARWKHIARALPWAFMGIAVGWIFLILNTSKIPFSWELGFITGETLLFNMCMLPALVIGSLVGVKALRRINNRTFSALVKVFALIAAGYLFFR